MTTAFFNPDLHPRAGDGTFTETYHEESALTLGPSAAAGLDLAFIDAMAADIRLAAGYHAVDRKLPDDEEEAAWQAYTAARKRLQGYGGADKAAIFVGEMIAARGEVLAGITVNEIRSGSFIRIEAAFDAHKAADEAWAARPGRQWDEDLYKQMDAARIAYSDARDGRDEDTKADMRKLADGYLAALGEVRPMGGELDLHPGSDPAAVRLFKDAAQFYPSEWVQTSNDYHPLLASYSKQRGHYSDTNSNDVIEQVPVYATTTQIPGTPALEDQVLAKYDWTPTGKTAFTSYKNKETGVYEFGELPEYRSVSREVIYPGTKHRTKKDGTPWGKDWEPWTHPGTGELYWRRTKMQDSVVDSEKVSRIRVGKRKTNYMEGRDPDMSTATHELGHRMQYAVGSLGDLERTFLTRRTLVESEEYPGEMVLQELELIDPDKKNGEYTRPDHFPNRYMGKDYPVITEIATTGMESLFTGTNGGLIGIGRYDPDLEFRSFILGAVATAGGSKKHEPAMSRLMQLMQ